MKKHNEGYALPFVLVVLVVMCIISVGIMDFCLRNLQSQQNTIQRMEAKYEAAGEIEKIVAAIENAETTCFFKTKEQLGFSTVPVSQTESRLRIAASHETGSGEQLWVIAELNSTDTDWPPAANNNGLTITKKATVEYTWYEIVDSDTAAAFLEGTYPGNGGNGQ